MRDILLIAKVGIINQSINNYVPGINRDDLIRVDIINDAVSSLYIAINLLKLLRRYDVSILDYS